MDPSTRRLIDDDEATGRPLIKPLARLVTKTHSHEFQSVPRDEVETNVDDDDDDDGGCQLESLRVELRSSRMGQSRRRSVTAPPSPTAIRPPPRTPSRRPHLPHLPHLIPWRDFRGRWGSDSVNNRGNEVVWFG